MITLLADRPYPPHMPVLDQFGRLAGLWETQITVYPPDGSDPRQAEGEWEFSYALDGRAVIDVWQVPGRRALAGAERAPEQECGLCVRIWDPRLQLWRFTFHGTASGAVVHMFARTIGDEIVMERAEGGRLARWIFSDLGTQTFHWRSESSTEGGRSWRLDQEVDARRLTGEATLASGRGDELARTLAAVRPHPSLGDQARLFDQFVGIWDCDYSHFDAAGNVTARYSGEVTFGWILDGRALQDVWVGEPSGTSERDIGTSIRFLDSSSGLWNVFWFAPEAGVVTTVKGGEVGDRILLEGKNEDGSLRRWSFNDIRPDSFVWRGERSTDDGKTWYLTADYRMTRRIGRGAPPFERS